jgi:hypothetical protein
MPLQVIVFSLEGLIGTDGLIIKRFHVWRKKPVQAKFCALLLGKCGAFIRDRSLEEIHATMNIQSI